MAEWVSGRFNFHYLELGIFRVVVGWDSTVPKGEPTGFRVSFGDARLKNIFTALDEAKEAGELMAKRKLTEALDALPKKEELCPKNIKTP